MFISYVLDVWSPPSVVYQLRRNRDARFVVTTFLIWRRLKAKFPWSSSAANTSVIVCDIFIISSARRLLLVRLLSAAVLHPCPPSLRSADVPGELFSVGGKSARAPLFSLHFSGSKVNRRSACRGAPVFAVLFPRCRVIIRGCANSKYSSCCCPPGKRKTIETESFLRLSSCRILLLLRSSLSLSLALSSFFSL